MKKRYDTPTAEKLEFDYTDTVVASGQIAGNDEPNNPVYTEYGNFCRQP